MKHRRFGKTGWQVSEIGYGMWGMAGWKGSNDDESLASLQQAVDLGCTFFDTAHDYGDGHSEKLLGELIRANRITNPDKKLYTASKVPPKNQQWPSRREFALTDCYPADHIQRYVESSLNNSGLPSFDLMHLHTWEDSWLEDRQWFDKLSELKAQGLIHAIGISINRWEPWNGVQAVRSGLIDAVQCIYNVFDQNPEDELLPACAEHDVGLARHLLRSRKPQQQRRPRRRPAPLASRGHGHGRTRHAFHPRRTPRQHHHPRHAQKPARRRQHGEQRQGTVARRASGLVEGPPLGPRADGVVAVATLCGGALRGVWQNTRIGPIGPVRPITFPPITDHFERKS